MPPRQVRQVREKSQAKTAEEKATLKNNIKWDTLMDEGLANRLAKKWREWSSGNKMGLCREWATELKIIQDDETGVKTKAHVHQMISRYNQAKDLEKTTGAGSLLQKKIRLNGKWETVDMDLRAQ